MTGLYSLGLYFPVLKMGGYYASHSPVSGNASGSPRILKYNELWSRKVSSFLVHGWVNSIEKKPSCCLLSYQEKRRLLQSSNSDVNIALDNRVSTVPKKIILLYTELE